MIRTRWSFGAPATTSARAVTSPRNTTRPRTRIMRRGRRAPRASPATCRRRRTCGSIRGTTIRCAFRAPTSRRSSGRQTPARRVTRRRRRNGRRTRFARGPVGAGRIPELRRGAAGGDAGRPVRAARCWRSRRCDAPAIARASAIDRLGPMPHRVHAAGGDHARSTIPTRRATGRRRSHRRRRSGNARALSAADAGRSGEERPHRGGTRAGGPAEAQHRGGRPRRLHQALDEYIAVQTYNADRPEGRLNLGNLYAARGDAARDRRVPRRRSRSIPRRSRRA